MAISRDDAVAIAIRYLERHQCRVVPSVEGLEWVDGQWLTQYDECHFVTFERPHWSVLFKDQLHPELLFKHPAGPIVLVDAESGQADFFAAM